MEVGFLGLGIMGKTMAMNLLRNAFKVTVWNRTLSKEIKKPIDVCEGSDDDCVIIDADDYKINNDSSVPTFVQHTEAMLEEIDRMDEGLEMDGIDELVMDIDNICLLHENGEGAMSVYIKCQNHFLWGLVWRDRGGLWQFAAVEGVTVTYGELASCCLSVAPSC